MTILDAALAETVKTRIESLTTDFLYCYGSLENLKHRKDYYSRGLYTGRKQALQAEIGFLTELLMALTNTMQKPAENPDPAPDAEPGQ